MSKQTESRAEIIARLCSEFPEAGNKTIARRLHAEFPAIFPTLEPAYQAVRYHRGNHGTNHRKHAKQPRPNGKAGQLPPLPKPVAESWEPFEIPAKRVLVFGDVHLPYYSKTAIDAVMRYGDTYKPDAIFINGDLFDYPSLSRFDKHPDMPKVADELLAGGMFWDHIRKRFPKAKLYYKLGNHDERFWKYICNLAPLLADIPSIKNGWQEPAGIDRNKVTIIDDKRPVMAGKLPMLHGHELGGGGIVNPARGALLKTNHTVLINHFHRSSTDNLTNLWHDEMHGWSLGCTCQLTPRFARINKWNWGAAAVDVNLNGTFNVLNFRIAKDGSIRSS